MSKMYYAAAAVLVVLAGCGGGDDQTSSSNTAQPPTQSITFTALDATIEIVENDSTSVDLSVSGASVTSYAIDTGGDIPMGWSIEGEQLTLTAPEVSQDERVYIAVIAQDAQGGVLVEDGFYVSIVNDNSRLIAPEYDGVGISADAITETPQWRVEQFGFHVDFVEPYGLDNEVCYPTPDDQDACSVPEVTYPDTTNYALGDFTGNGHQDLVIAIYMTPHTAPRIETQNSYLLFFENDGQGNVTLNNDRIPDRVDLNRFSMYRLEAADLNGDGVDDLVISGGIRVTDTPGEEPGTYILEPEPIVLLLSHEGRLVDASDRLDIELGEGRNFNQRAISLGDITGNGHPDIFISRAIVQNNGDGTFTELTDLYFTDHERLWGEPYATAVGDLTGDGFNDLIVLHATPLDPESPHSYVLTSSTGDGDLTLASEPRRLHLPEPTWGSNGRVNDAAMGKLLAEFPGEQLVIADTRTEPYYNGRMLRLYGYADGELVDLTSRIVGDDIRRGEGTIEYASGEGMVRVLDFNNDGLLDIVDTTAGSKDCLPPDECIQGISVFLNDGDGYFHYTPIEELAVITRSELRGYEGDQTRLSYYETFPIDLGHPDGVELLTRIETLPQEALLEGDLHSLMYYMIRRKEDGLQTTP